MMTTTEAANYLNVMRGTAFAAWTPYAVLFTADPGDAGSLAAEVAGSGYARQPPTMGAPSGKSTANTGLLTFSLPAGTVVTHVGFADALTVGTLRRRGPVTGARAVTDAVTTAASAVLTSATAAFVAGDVSKPVGGAGIPAGTTILSWQSATSVTMNANATVAGTGVALTIGGIVTGTSGQITVAAGALIDAAA